MARANGVGQTLGVRHAEMFGCGGWQCGQWLGHGFRFWAPCPSFVMTTSWAFCMLIPPLSAKTSTRLHGHEAAHLPLVCLHQFIKIVRRSHPQHMGAIALLRSVQNARLHCRFNQAETFHAVQATFVMAQACTKHQVLGHEEFNAFRHSVLQ